MLSGQKNSFDVIFCDPPFPYAYKKELLEAISNSPLMQETSLLLIHYPREEQFETPPGKLMLTDRRQYGRSLVDFYSLQN